MTRSRPMAERKVRVGAPYDHAVTTSGRRWLRFVDALLIVCAIGLLGATYSTVVSAHSAPSGTLASEGAQQSTMGPISALQAPANSVSPEQFGARGNGTTDDTKAVQAAINVAHGRTVWLGVNKTYIIRRELRLPSDTTIRGAGSSSTLRFTWFEDAGPRSGGVSYLASSGRGVGASNVTLSNFVVLGAGSGQPSGLNRLYPTGLASGIRINGADHFSITHLEIADTPGFALGEFGSRRGTIEYNYIRNSGRGGIGLWWYVRTADSVTISHNRVGRVGDDAIAVHGLPTSSGLSTAAPSTWITHNVITGWRRNINGRMLGNGIALYGVTGVAVERNSVRNTYGAGILLQGCNLGLCAGPHGRHLPQRGPWQSSAVKILHNTITNAGKLYRGSTQGQRGIPAVGIYVTATTRATIAGNKIRRPLFGRVHIRTCKKCLVRR